MENLFGLKTFNKNKPAMGDFTKKVQMLMNFVLNGKLSINQGTWKQCRDESGKEIARDKITQQVNQAGVRLIRR